MEQNINLELKDKSTESRLESLKKKHDKPNSPDTFSNYPLSLLRMICEALHLKSIGSRRELCNSLIKFIDTPEGISYAYKVLDF